MTMSDRHWTPVTESVPPCDEGRWYWVSDGVTHWPAARASYARNGWTNMDTWEDYDGTVAFWCAIEEPPCGRCQNLGK